LEIRFRDRIVNANDAMQFTGERFTPECEREIWYEHWHRYVFARTLTRGKRVLDAACGEGYGSALLADVASSVVGVDISEDAISHARSRYGTRANLRFERGDCTALDVPGASFDVIVSFETLEHVAAQEALIAGFARALAPDGILIVSSPDKKTYSDDRGFSNEFHVRELYRDELMNLLSPQFPFVRLYGQKLLFQSAIWKLDGQSRTADVVTTAGEAHATERGLRYDPLYFIALCSRRPLPDGMAELALFGDREESVYSHYNSEVRRNMAAGARIAELERENQALRASAGIQENRSPQRSSWWRRLFTRGAR
jgi:ubiquinone/menaquinone biosynthesis C-methylase UbiE